MAPGALALLLLATAGAVELFEGQAFYIGDPHAHTGASGDAGGSDIGECSTGDCGALSEVKQVAIDNGLDWMSLTDHVNGTAGADPDDWERAWAAGLAADDPDAGFLVLPGTELWYSMNGTNIGHKNVYWFGDNEQLAELTIPDVTFDGSETRIPECAVIWDWAEAARERWGELLVVAHHPGMDLPLITDWSCHTDERAAALSPVVEVYSEHGNSMEPDSAFDPPTLDSMPLSTIDHVLDPDGWNLRLGFMGGTDAHDTRPGSVCRLDGLLTHHDYAGGLTVLVIPDSEPFERAQVYAALTERRSYATSGPLLPAVIEVSSAGALLGGMGEELAFPTEQPVDLAVRVPAEHAAHVDAVLIVGPGLEQALDPAHEGAWTGSIGAGELPPWVYVEIVVDGASWWGDGGCEDGGETMDEHIWLSPVWFDDGPGDLDADGSSWAEGDCDDGDPGVGPHAQEDCSSGVDDDCDGWVDGDDPDCGGQPDTGPEDSVVPIDSDPPEDTGETPPELRCGCGVVRPAVAFLPLLAGILGVRRRRLSRPW